MLVQEKGEEGWGGRGSGKNGKGTEGKREGERDVEGEIGKGMEERGRK